MRITCAVKSHFKLLSVLKQKIEIRTSDIVTDNNIIFIQSGFDNLALPLLSFLILIFMFVKVLKHVTQCTETLRKPT
jgi:hypothetical protein